MTIFTWSSIAISGMWCSACNRIDTKLDSNNLHHRSGDSVQKAHLGCLDSLLSAFRLGRKKVKPLAPCQAKSGSRMATLVQVKLQEGPGITKSPGFVPLLLFIPRWAMALTELLVFLVQL